MSSSKKDGVSGVSTRSKFGSQEALGGDEMSISQLATLLSSKLETTKADIFRKIDGELANVKSEIKAELNTVRTELEKKIGDLRSSVHHNKTTIQSINDMILRSRNANDLIVSGVPYSQNENLPVYFAKWCRRLGYPDGTNPLVDARRISKLPMTPGKSYPIMLQFAITNHRSDFYAKYLQTRSLTLEDIGFQSSNRIFVNENLTTGDRALKAKALAARKQGKLVSVYTRNGIVCVKKTTDGDRCQITSEDQLLEFLQ